MKYYPQWHCAGFAWPVPIAGWKPLSLPLAILLGMTLSAQDFDTQVEISPASPTTNDSIAYKLSGTWSNGCVPQSPKVSFAGTSIRIETVNPGTICSQAFTPWTLTGTFGKLTAGSYQIAVTYSSPSVPATLEIARKSFTVIAAAPVNELVLPVVVNGVVAEKLHYQTIFTLLNSSKEEVRATLQVYGNNGKPGGAFCSPLAPPPSSASMSLRPGAQYFQFTSSDLPFLNGWALVRWEGPASILAGAEVTLAAAAPAPCLLICNRPSTEKLSSAQTPAVKAATEFRLPATINKYRQTALALINPSTTQTVSIKITILDASGDSPRLGLPASFEEQIRPLERTSKFLWQLAQEHSALTVIVPPPEAFQGSVMLSSDAPFAAGAMNIMFPEGKFVSIPVITPAP